MLRFISSLFLMSVVSAQVSYFSAALEGAQEVPPVATAGRGWAVVKVEQPSNLVKVYAFYESLSGSPTAAHLHQGAIGANGGVVLPLAASGLSSFSGSATLTSAQVAAIISNGSYVNFHSGANPGGEIRGQVVPSVSTRYSAVLSAASEVPPNSSVATGTALAFLHEPENRVVYLVNASGFSGSVTAAHFHQGIAGANGGVAFSLNGSSGNYAGVTNRLSATQLAAFKANGFYANIHTSVNPGGEIRGQLLRDAGNHFVAHCDASQEVPPVASPAFAEASLILAANGLATVSGRFSGIGTPTAAHVHIGSAGTNGGVVFPLTFGGGVLAGSFSPNATDLVNLRSGNWYLNVHSVLAGGGEIRGQFITATTPTTFGEGCIGSNATRPQIGARGLPVLGTSVSIDLYGALPNALCLFAFGADRDAASGLSLPIELTSIGLNSPKCFVLVDPSTTLVSFADAFGFASINLGLPLIPSFRGINYYSQWYVFDSSANIGGLVTSSALKLDIK